MVAILGTAMLASPLTATIYFPLLPMLSEHFHTSIQAVNLTITVYIIFQAVSPVLLASTSDHFGRRPIYLFSFALFASASLGLALNKSSYAALLILRALQSLGASSVLSVSYGTIADICVPAEKGKMLGPMLSAGNLGTAVGPILGGCIAFASGGFQWAFWALFIFAAMLLSAIAMLLPETARNVVGNGSIQDKPWNRPLWILLEQPYRKGWNRMKHLVSQRRMATNTINSTTGEHTESIVRTFHPPGRSFRVKSPLRSFRILFYRDTSLIIWLSSSFYALWYCVQATIPITYKAEPYSLNELQIGLTYLTGATGVIACMWITGKIMDRDYQDVAQRAGVTVDRVRGDDLSRFPIEQARSCRCEYLLFLSTCCTIGYGWTITQGVHISVPLILQFFQGFICTWIINMFSALLTDIFPENAGAASTAGNMSRCVLSAIVVALLAPVEKLMGKGWLFTMLGILTGLGGLVCLVVLRRWGMYWRSQRDRVPKGIHNEATHGHTAISMGVEHGTAQSPPTDLVSTIQEKD